MTLTRLRRRIPKRIRQRVLALAGRSAPTEPDRLVTLELPTRTRANDAGTGLAPAGDDGPRALTIRTPARTYVTKLLERDGLAGYEPQTLAAFLGAIDHAGCVEGAAARPTAYDVGANIGVFSWLGAVLTDARVVAFEPTPDLAAQMRAIRDANGLRFDVEELALGAADGTAELHLSDKTDSSNSLRAGFRPSHQSVTVKVETLDGYIARTGARPQVLKIDTESTEPDVLRGGATLLGDDRPWIICEVLAGRSEDDLMAILRPLGYRWYRIDGMPPWTERETIEGDPTYTHMNWLFAPEAPPSSFWEAVSSWSTALQALPRPTH